MNCLTRAGLVLISLLLSAAPVSALPQKRIPAKAAVVMDPSGTILFSKFPDAKLAPASTVKLITAMVVLDNLSPDYTVTISKTASKARSIQLKLRPDEEMTVNDLLHLALITSVNAAAVALAEATAGTEQDFVVLMNRKAAELGAHRSLYATASGLPKGLQYTTANDLALIMKAALSYPLIREILGKKSHVVRTAAGRDIFLYNSNELLWQKENIIGKTGYTGNARHCFVSAINTEKGPLITAVLGARSRTGLWKSTMLLADYAMKADPTLSRENIFIPWKMQKPTLDEVLQVPAELAGKPALEQVREIKPADTKSAESI